MLNILIMQRTHDISDNEDSQGPEKAQVKETKTTDGDETSDTDIEEVSL